MKNQILVLIAFVLFGCSSDNKKKENKSMSKEAFIVEINQLKEYFQIPGLAVLIKNEDRIIYEDYLGFSDIENQIPIDKTTTIPMASLTKIFSGIVIMQLMEEKKLSLDDPINNYLPSAPVADSVKIAHVLSHTSQGNVGENFYYSNRFGWLTYVIEKASDQTFEEAIQKRIIDKLGLQNTFLLKDEKQLTSKNYKIALPYILGGEVKNGVMEKKTQDGFIDYGFSSSAGITSTVSDLGILDDALKNNILISENSKQMMGTPFNEKSPYGLGIFTQSFMNEKLEWGYGQYDCYSSLFLRIPSKNLTFIIAANNNLMSDPARLINGDVTTSLFAQSFLKNFVFDLEEPPLFETENSLTTIEARIDNTNKDFYRSKLLAQLSAENYMSRFDQAKAAYSKVLLKRLFVLFPDYKDYGDLNLLFNLQFIKAIGAMRGNPEITDFDHQYLSIANKLLSIDGDDPYVNYYMANYHQIKNNRDSTSYYYSKIVNAKNFSPWWYTNEAKRWLETEN